MTTRASNLPANGFSKIGAQPLPALKGHHIRQIALVAVAASWAGIFYAVGLI